MLEKEVKIVLSKRQYETLFQLFVWDKSILQENYYYRRHEDINDNITVRIRKKENNILLQVKIPIKKEGSLHIKKEYEKKIKSIEEKISGAELNELTGNEFTDVYLIGRLITKRSVCNLYENVKICLDINQYFDKTDYDVEVEYIGDYPAKIVSIIKEQGIDTDKKVNGKYSRFLKEFKIQNRHKGI